ncbi:PRD domain-containing protein [Luteococcus sp. H138]|uniref:BglG family transcription antiterminator n=1 Tax=unclassified Luteococcus TaxID=2639923 RepID=UPI00313E9911
MQRLLTSRDYVKLDEIAEALFVSRTTITQDLRNIEGVLRDYSLLIDRKPYHGVKVVGAEFDIRHCLTSHFTGVGSLLNPDQIPFRQIAERALCEPSIPISKDLLDNLSVHLAAALLRVTSGNVYPDQQASLRPFVTDRELDIADRLMRAVEQAVGLPIPRGEVSYLALNLAGKRILGGKESGDALTEQAHLVVDAMMGVLDETYGFELYQDETLAGALTQHTAALMVRLRFGMTLSNPVKDQIKRSHPLAFVMASQASSLLGREIGAEVDEDEVAYIALWLELALQRRRPPHPRRRVLVACASGLGTARLMEFAFRDRFPELIESITSMEAHRVTAEDLEDVDIAFSTVPMDVPADTRLHLISDFLAPEDEPRIRQALLRRPSVDVAQYFRPELFIGHLQAASRHDAIQQLALACHHTFDLPDVFEQSILRREELSSTDFGNLVAMPHAEVAMSSETFVCVGVLEEPIQWHRHRVQAVFLVSVSSLEGEDLRRFYGSLTRLLMNPEHVNYLIENRDFEALIVRLQQIAQDLEVD